MEKFYYELHVNYGHGGYSIAIESDKELTEDEAITQAKLESKFEEPWDADLVDYVGEISLVDYDTFFFEKA